MSAWTRYAAQITRPGSSDSPARDCCDNRTLAVALKAGETTSNNQNARTGADGAATQLAAVAFVTTEHFTLQGARTAAITESTSRATIFIGSVSAGLVALGLIAAATRIGTAFYAFGLILLSTLSFLGFVTLDRVLQSGIEELHYVERIARLRAYYFDFAPELTPLPGQRPAIAAACPPGLAQRVLGSLPDDRRNDRRRHRSADRL